MSSENAEHRCSLPACKSTTPGGCSDCNLAYDCQRAASGVPSFMWPLAALLLVGIMAIAFNSFGG